MVASKTRLEVCIVRRVGPREARWVMALQVLKELDGSNRRLIVTTKDGGVTYKVSLDTPAVGVADESYLITDVRCGGNCWFSYGPSDEQQNEALESIEDELKGDPEPPPSRHTHVLQRFGPKRIEALLAPMSQRPGAAQTTRLVVLEVSGWEQTRTGLPTLMGRVWNNFGYDLNDSISSYALSSYRCLKVFAVLGGASSYEAEIFQSTGSSVTRAIPSLDDEKKMCDLMATRLQEFTPHQINLIRTWRKHETVPLHLRETENPFGSTSKTSSVYFRVAGDEIGKSLLAAQAGKEIVLQAAIETPQPKRHSLTTLLRSLVGGGEKAEKPTIH